jgi:predicted RNA-binding Zn ribbon-like protein
MANLSNAFLRVTSILVGATPAAKTGMKPLLLGGHPALEFLDTTMVIRGEPVELIGDGHAFLDWLVAVDLLPSAVASTLARRSSVTELDAAAAEARTLRAWTVAWLTRWCEAPADDYAPEMRKLNTLLSRSALYRQVERQEGQLVIVERRSHRALEELVGIVADAIANLVATETPALVKRCAGADCTLWFLDRTKAHRRRFCSVAACGNREKVAAFRERQRSAGSDRSRLR